MSIVQDVTWVGGVELQEREAQRGREPCEESAITITWGVASVGQGFIQGKTFMQALAVIKDGDDDGRTRGPRHGGGHELAAPTTRL